MRAWRSTTTVLKLLVHAYPGGWSPYSRTRIRVSIGATHVWVSGWIWVNPLSPTPTVGSQPVKSHAKGNNTVFFNGYATSKKKYTCKTIWFVCLLFFAASWYILLWFVLCWHIYNWEINSYKKNPVKSYVRHHTVGMPQLFFTICNFNIGHQFERFVAKKQPKIVCWLGIYRQFMNWIKSSIMSTSWTSCAPSPTLGR